MITLSMNRDYVSQYSWQAHVEIGRAEVNERVELDAICSGHDHDGQVNALA